MNKEDESLAELAKHIGQTKKQSAPSQTLSASSPIVGAYEPPFPNLQSQTPIKEWKSAGELAEMILNDLKQVAGCPRSGLQVTVYGLNPWNSWLHFGAAAGPVRNKQELQDFCALLTERLRARYEISV